MIPRRLLIVGLAIATLDALVLVVVATIRGDPSLLSHATTLLLVAALLWALDRCVAPAREGRRARVLSRLFASLLLAGAGAGLALVHDWRLDSPWTPPALFLVVWLAALAVGSGWQHLRERRDGA